MDSQRTYTDDNISLLPICILRDDYNGSQRIGTVHVNDIFRPNKRILGGALREDVATGFPFTEYHFHKGVEILRINEGEATVVIAGKSYRATAGDVLMVNPYEAHAIYLAHPENSFSRSCLVFDPDDIFPIKSSGNIFSRLKSMHFENYVSSHDGAREICSVIDKIVTQARCGDSASAVGVLASLMELYAVLIRSGECRNAGMRTPYREEFVTRVSDYVEKNLFGNITTSSAASYSKYSDEHFCRMFKTCFGTTFHDYVTERRIAVARMHLDNGDIPSIATLAAECGFKSHNHFTNMFRRHVGASPSEYIKRKGNTK